MMLSQDTNIAGVVTLHPVPIEDARGGFVELYGQNVSYFPEGVRQISQSVSHKNVLRGLHFQYNPLMGKVMRVIRGAAWIVNVDLRMTSATFLKYCAVECTAENQIMVLAPGWAARGFLALADDTTVEYFHDAVHTPATTFTIRWNDPDIGIDWPITSPILSDKDRAGSLVTDWLQHLAAPSLDIPPLSNASSN